MDAIGIKAINVQAFQLALTTVLRNVQRINFVQHNQDRVLPINLSLVHHLQHLKHAQDLIHKQVNVLGLMIIHANLWSQAVHVQILAISQTYAITLVHVPMREVLVVLLNALISPLSRHVILFLQVIPLSHYVLGLMVLVLTLLTHQLIPKLLVIKEHLVITSGHLTINALLATIWLAMIWIAINSFLEHSHSY